MALIPKNRQEQTRKEKRKPRAKDHDQPGNEPESLKRADFRFSGTVRIIEDANRSDDCLRIPLESRTLKCYGKSSKAAQSANPDQQTKKLRDVCPDFPPIEPGSRPIPCLCGKR